MSCWKSLHYWKLPYIIWTGMGKVTGNRDRKIEDYGKGRFCEHYKLLERYQRCVLAYTGSLVYQTTTMCHFLPLQHCACGQQATWWMAVATDDCHTEIRRYTCKTDSHTHILTGTHKAGKIDLLQQLTPWSRVLLEKLTVSQLAKKFDKYCRNQICILMF